LNYLLGLSFLAKYTDLRELKSVVEIGGGFGTLGEILSQTHQDDRFCYVDLDIPPTCLFAEYYLKHACPAHFAGSVSDYLEGDTPINIESLSSLSVLPNWAIERLSGHVDLFVNFISFQEMEPHVVQNYLEHVARLAPKWILLRNLREGKQQRSQSNPVGVDTPVLSTFYAQALPQYECVGSDADVFGFTTSDNFHSELLAFKITS
ncbi:MAG: putative sugar O-methyltransferase, partial [Myxococcota bacterium]